MSLHKEDAMHSHRPPLPNPQPDPGPLPDPAPVPSPEPSPIPEPLPPQFGAHETRNEVVSDGAYVKSGEIGQEDSIHFVKGQDGPKWVHFCSHPSKFESNPRGVISGMRFGLILVIALPLCTVCEPRKPPPMVSYGKFDGGLPCKFEKS